MVLYGYDASVYNAVQGSDNWVAYFNNPDANIIGAVNTSYTVGAIVAGFFIGGPVADYFGRRVGMASGAACVVVATFMVRLSSSRCGVVYAYASLANFLAKGTDRLLHRW